MFLSSADCFQNYFFRKFLPTGNICMFMSRADLFSKSTFLKKKTGNHQSGSAQFGSRPGPTFVGTGLILDQSVCKGYQTTLDGKELMKFFFLLSG